METVGAFPNIFEYMNFRKYLADRYAHGKRTQRGFSFRLLSKQIGFKSPNFIKLVIDGKRDLSSESIGKIAGAFSMSKEESFYFRNLVLLNQAVTAEEKRFHSGQLLESGGFQKVQPLRKAQLEYYSEWYYVAVRELVDTADFREDPEWIGSRLEPAISPVEAKRAVENLLLLGLIVRRPDGRLAQSASIVSTGDEIESAAVSQFHREMMKMGSDAIERFDPSVRDISCFTASLSDEGAAELKRLVQRFRKELLAIAKNDRGQGAVYQVNFQLFPLARQASARVAKKKEAA